jgi:hypothetical protein
MLKKDKFSVLLLVFLLLISCKDSEREFSYTDKIYSTEKYKKIHLAAIDSINKWIIDSLSVTGLEFNNKWKLDNRLFFNSDSTRLFTVILDVDTIYKNSPSDNIRDFGGAKIGGKWYFFFMGVSEPVDRSYWQDSVYAPLTFEELSYVAYERIL